MNAIEIAAVAVAALELLPAEPGDLARILSDPASRADLVGKISDESDPLLQYLVSELDQGRIETWAKRLDRLVIEGIGRPCLAGDDEYPALLASCWDHPPVLFLRGELAPSRPSLAIVGSREATTMTLAATHKLAKSAATAGMSVVSGLAAGIDTAAHAGALDAGGHTVAVLGTGIGTVFPEQNIELAERIAATGALVSQFPPGSPRTSTTFLRRNSVIAGMAATSVIMDAQARSGSRHQAEQAIRYGRQVLLWSSTLSDQTWANKLVRDGSAMFVHSEVEVLEQVQAHDVGRRN